LAAAFLTAQAARTAAWRSVGRSMVNSAITAEMSSYAAINRAATSIA
jgi:hypothetical protein